MAIYSKFVIPGLLILAASTLGNAAVVPLPITNLPSSESVGSPSSLAVSVSVKSSAPEATITGSVHTKARREDESSECSQYGYASALCDLFDIEKRTAEAQATASGRAEQISQQTEEVIPVHADKISPAERIIARQEDEGEDEDSGVTEEIGEAAEEIGGEAAEDGAELLDDLFDSDKRDIFDANGGPEANGIAELAEIYGEVLHDISDKRDIFDAIGDAEADVIADVAEALGEVLGISSDKRGTRTERQTDLDDEILEEISEAEDEIVGDVDEVKEGIEEEVEDVVNDIFVRPGDVRFARGVHRR